MSVGSLQTIIVCGPSADGSTTTPCATGQAPQVTQAYVLAPDSASFIDQAAAPFDYAVAAVFWTSSFVLTIWLYVLPRGIGEIVRMVRRA